MQTEWAIRPMVDTDFPAMMRIYQQGIESGLATFETAAPDWAAWDAAHLRVCRLVLEEGGEVRGWAALTAHSSRCVFNGVAEVSIYLDEAVQGRGHGTRLLDVLTEQSEAHGLWTLYSWIFSNNTASIRLHEKCGYRLVGVREKIGRDRFGAWRDVTILERRSKDPRFL